jgi:hypothetical protein
MAMKVQIEDHDVVVVKTDVTVLDEDRETPCDLIHTVQVVDQNGDDLFFVVLWSSFNITLGREQLAPSLMWRGSFESAMGQFTCIVGDLLTERNATAHLVPAAADVAAS